MRLNKLATTKIQLNKNNKKKILTKLFLSIKLMFPGGIEMENWATMG